MNYGPTHPIGELRKNRSETVRVGLQEIGGRDYLALRTWYTAEDGRERPGKQGLTLRADAIPELRDLLTSALRGHTRPSAEVIALQARDAQCEVIETPDGAA